MAKTIKTNIKFYKGLDNVENRLYGFVTKTNGSWKGCREEEPRKKIVFVDTSLADSIIPNALYRCVLTPMNSREGFIATSATSIKFKATILSTCRREVFVVRVKFGNKTLIYDPSSDERRKRDIQAIADNLRNRHDLENAQAVAEDFVSTACMVKHLYEQAHVH